MKYKIGLITVFCVVVLISCKQEFNTNDQLGTKHQNNHGVLKHQSTTRILNDSLINLMGRRHNDVMGDALEHINWSSSSIGPTLDNYFLNYQDPSIDSLISNRSDIGGVLKSIDAYLSDSTSTELYQMFQDCKSIVEEMPSYSELLGKINEKRSFARENFVGSDLDVALVFLDVLEKSSQFWMPESKGGSGVGWSFIIGYCNDHNLDYTKVNWGAIGWADGAGAVGTLIRTWYFAAWGPLSWGAIVGAIGWGAAWGSGLVLLYQLM